MLQKFAGRRYRSIECIGGGKSHVSLIFMLLLNEVRGMRSDLDDTFVGEASLKHYFADEQRNPMSLYHNYRYRPE